MVMMGIDGLTCFEPQEEANGCKIEKDEEGDDDPGKYGWCLAILYQLRGILYCKVGPLVGAHPHIIHGGGISQASGWFKCYL